MWLWRHELSSRIEGLHSRLKPASPTSLSYCPGLPENGIFHRNMSNYLLAECSGPLLGCRPPTVCLSVLMRSKAFVLWGFVEGRPLEGSCWVPGSQNSHVLLEASDLRTWLKDRVTDWVVPRVWGHGCSVTAVMTKVCWPLLPASLQPLVSLVHFQVSLPPFLSLAKFKQSPQQ